jgi:hypothetical protein
MSWVCFVMYKGSLRCICSAGSADVSLRVDGAISRLVVGSVFFPLCSFACTPVAYSIGSWVCPSSFARFSSNGVQSLTPSSQRGLKEYVGVIKWLVLVSGLYGVVFGS